MKRKRKGLYEKRWDFSGNSEFPSYLNYPQKTYMLQLHVH